ncbi:MAG: CheR family methyltransferase [Polyangiaceae bacterium]|nr:CheR family methyltransferase [Polyangiaceae bacterium]
MNSSSAQSANGDLLSAAEFERVAHLAYEAAGLEYRDGKQALVGTRLQRRMRLLGVASYSSYLDLVEADPKELAEMVDVLTTNKTNFFRESRHFDLLVEEGFGVSAAEEPLRIWSAGCSTGEEPYTLAMLLAEQLEPSAFRQARILATDISSRVLGVARAAIYDEDQLVGVDEARRAKHFERVPAGHRVRAPLRERVHVARLNLMESWPMRGPFHAIFCRNVMIYFDLPTRLRVVGRFYDLLAPGGLLFIGMSESLGQTGHPFHYVEPAVYRR